MRAGRLRGREPRLDLDLRAERSVHGAAICDLEEPCSLRFVERAAQRDLAFDAVEQADLRLAVRAVGRVDAFVAQRHLDALQGPALAVRVQAQGHPGAGAEG